MIRDRVLWLLLATAGAHAPVSAAPALPHRPGAPTTCAVIPLAGAKTAEIPSALATRNSYDQRSYEQRATIASFDPVVRYEIMATLDPFRHTIDGDQLMTWRNRSALPVCTLYVQLDLNAFEGAGSRLMAERRAADPDFRLKDGDWGYSQLTRIQQEGKSAVWMYEQPDDGPVTDHTVVRVDLPQPIAPGASTTLDIGFFNRLPGARTGTGHYGSFHLIAHW
ncbi:MAG TPA: M1 family peptidase, partial [Lysobacter sp.]|nr:M1 family peptidase [Lysobacter sp.]